MATFSFARLPDTLQRRGQVALIDLLDFVVCQPIFPVGHFLIDSVSPKSHLSFF
jgi:hypothetical protein